MVTPQRQIPRQKVIAGAGLAMAAGALAACAGSPTDANTAGSPQATSSPPADAPGNVIVKAADVPVGSGVIIDKDKIVVTQPTAGVFKGFSAVCTHAGCTVADVAGGTIICPCHSSKFNLDGSVAQGPAARPLDPVPISVQGDFVVSGP